MTTYKLSEIATIVRARTGEIYPKGSTLIQVSATRGTVGYLDKDSAVGEQYAVVTPSDKVNAKYLHSMIDKGIHKFLAKYQQGLNVPFESISLMQIDVYKEHDTIGKNIEIIEREEIKVQKEIEILQAMKKRFLKDMFPA